MHATLPSKIVVPAAGVSEPWLLGQLGLTTAQVHPLHGEELGAPRDYRYGGNCHYYTAAGVERLVRIYKLPVAVLSEPMLQLRARPPRVRRWDMELEDRT